MIMVSYHNYPKCFFLLISFIFENLFYSLIVECIRHKNQEIKIRLMSYIPGLFKVRTIRFLIFSTTTSKFVKLSTK